MRRMFLLPVIVTAFGIARSSTINNADALRTRTNRGISSEDRIEKESPIYDDNDYLEFYEVLSLIRTQVKQVFDLTVKEYLGVSFDEAVDFGDEKIHELAFDLSEIRTLRDFANLGNKSFNMEVSNEEALEELQILSEIREPFEIIGGMYRALYRQWYRWGKKTNFAYDFPLKHSSVEEVEKLFEDTELFYHNVNALLSDVPRYENMNYTVNATEIHIRVVRLFEYKTFMEFYVGEGFAGGSGLAKWKTAQKLLSLIQSKEMKQALFGLTRNIPRFLDLLDVNGILGLKEPEDYGPIY